MTARDATRKELVEVMGRYSNPQFLEDLRDLGAVPHAP
jgi:hypothetical protein